MATDHQVALSRTHHRLPSTPSQHAAQQPRPVPAFLKKLYEMVNDPQNVALIRWSDSGDSFFVLDHERFAREVLGKWFKHQNFSSFVRQLNMYGFHKIPHLQQGVLRSGSETDFWNFGHANFHRGQADLLYLIHRKKGNSQQQIQMQQQMEEVAAAAAAATAAGFLADVNGNTVMGVGAQGAGANTIAGAGSPNAAATAMGASGTGSSSMSALNNSQILDIHSIVQGISAIQRHQGAISSELRELKRSNEMLWQDALLAREKHQKQEDTINRIVKFLAGVFGKHAPPGPGGVGGDGHHGEDENPGSNVSVQRRSGGGGGGGHQQDMHQRGNDGPRRRARLMIEDVRRQNKSVPSSGGKQGMNVVEVTEESDEDTMMNDVTIPLDNTGNGIGGGAGRDQPTSPVTLNLNGGPGSAEDTLGYPQIEMEIETPKSVNTPLPTSPAETVMGSNEKKETATNPHLLAALTAGRALARTPPVHSQQNTASNDNTGFSFDPRNLTINLTPAQIQQLLASVATQTIAEPPSNPNGYSGHHSDHYERGFLTPVDGDGSAAPKRDHTQHFNGTPPFDISSYLVPSPTLANLSIGSAVTSPGPSTSTPATSPMLSNPTPRVGGGNDSGAYRSGATSASVPVPDGLISFDGPEAANAAAAASQTSSAAGASAATTNAGTTGNTNAAPYAGDLSVLPWAAYQGYGGAYPPPVIPNVNAGSTTNGGAYGNGPPAGYTPYGFPYNPDGTWGNVGGSGTSDGGTSGDYSGLFSPLQASPRVGYSATTTGAAGAGAGVNGGQQGQNTDGSAVSSYNNPSSTGSAAGSVGQHSSNWQATEDIDRDVSAMHTSIHSLIQMLGLDPSLMSSGDGGEEEGDDEEDGSTGPKVSGTARSVADFDNFMNSWSAAGAGAGVMGPNGNGIMNRSSSESATTGSCSTPCASVPSHAGSVAGESPGGDGECVDGGEPSTTLGFARGSTSTSALPSSVTPVSASTRPQSAQSVNSGIVPVDDGTARPINKKARTGLTASAPTSAGVPTTVVEAGGRKRRSAIVNVPASAVDELDAFDGDLAQELGVTGAGTASQIQPKGAATAATSSKGTKSKKRRA
ncbi:hypothetical protein F5887DRAFT_1013084 [Amanita rubescens]|nr:hypothetical protein F5887DRAFT_1013084 [Amanita rubescens]